MGDDLRDPGGKKVFTAARIPKKGPLEGYLYVILGGLAYDSVMDTLQGSYILRLSSWMIGASLFFALAARLILFALLKGRLKGLAMAVYAYRAGHSGLGLAIARKILELHERTIGVYSVLGTDTTFTFYLPVYQPA